MRHLPVPGPPDVVLLPVIANNESNNAYANGGTVADHGNMRPLVEIADVSRIHPAPVFARNDITPAVVLHAPLDRYRKPLFQDRHDGIVHGGSGVQGYRPGGISHLGICRDRKQERCRSQDQHFQSVHVSPPLFAATLEFRLASSRDDSGKQLFQSVSAGAWCPENGVAPFFNTLLTCRRARVEGIGRLWACRDRVTHPACALRQ